MTAVATRHADQRGSTSLGHGAGTRLKDALDAVVGFPALAESRASLLRLVRSRSPSPGDIVGAVESDAALVITVLRMANGLRSKQRRRVATVPEAVELLTPDGVAELVNRMPVFDFFRGAPGWDRVPELFRLHAVAVQSAADRLARELDYPRRDELLVASILHDIGKLVLVGANPSYVRGIGTPTQTPRERIEGERRSMGFDHAALGATLIRRWGLPPDLAAAVALHHSDTATGAAAFIRVADMFVHYGHREPVDPRELVEAARALDLTPNDLRTLMYRLPSGDRPRNVEPCPLTSREQDVLKLLAAGKVYKQIALDLGLSASTVRSHTHNIYPKLGVPDRAQAVLLATDRGWI